VAEKLLIRADVPGQQECRVGSDVNNNEDQGKYFPLDNSVNHCQDQHENQEQSY
jgi:hypothetical protein